MGDDCVQTVGVNCKWQIPDMLNTHFLKFQIICLIKCKNIIAWMKNGLVVHADERIVAGPADVFDVLPLTDIRDQREIIHGKHKVVVVL